MRKALERYPQYAAIKVVEHYPLKAFIVIL